MTETTSNFGKDKEHNTSLNLNVSKINDLFFVIYDKNEHIQSFLTRGLLYEKVMLDYINKKYKGGVFVDVGACMGTHSLPFSKIADMVYSFEPFEPNFKMLFLNIILNKISNIRFFNCGLGKNSEVKELLMKNPTTPNGSPSFVKVKEERINKKTYKIKVPTIPLDLFKLDNVTLIKIDVEHDNISVLEGMTNTLRKNNADLFVECMTKKELEETTNFLKNFGYFNTGISFNSTPTILFKKQK